MEITIQTEYLRAMAILAAPKGDRRYFLQSVCLRVEAKRTLLIATDGKAIGILRLPHADCRPTEHIIPVDILKSLPLKGLALLTFDANYAASITVGGTKTTFTCLKDRYPDFFKILPTDPVSGKTAQFNPEYIMRFVKVRKVLTKDSRSPHIAHNGDKAIALVDIGVEDFIGGVMPLYATGQLELPWWLKA